MVFVVLVVFVVFVVLAVLVVFEKSLPLSNYRLFFFKKKWSPKLSCHNSETPKTIHGFRIIWDKFATIPNLATNQRPTLLNTSETFFLFRLVASSCVPFNPFNPVNWDDSWPCSVVLSDHDPAWRRSFFWNHWSNSNLNYQPIYSR